MQVRPRLVRAFVIASLVVVGSAAGVGRAHAEIIGMFTGSWYLQSAEGDIAAGRDQSIGRLQNLGGISGLDGYFGFTGVISNYSQQGCVPFEVPCTQTWSGTFSGGTVSFAAVGPTTEYTVTGVITGGSFQGEVGCIPEDCLGFNQATFSFISTSTRYVSLASGVVLNPWTSQGTLDVTSSCIGNCGGFSFGTLSMTTSTVPEPASMTLLGAGIAAFAGRRRRQRRE